MKCRVCGDIISPKRVNTNYCSLACEHKDAVKYNKYNMTRFSIENDSRPFRTETSCGYIHEIDPVLGF